jgi:hypothetical protein
MASSSGVLFPDSTQRGNNFAAISALSATSPGFVTAEIFLFLVDSAVHFKWLLNQSTATAMIGRRQILLGFSHHTSSTAGVGFTPPRLLKSSASFLSLV